MSTHVGRSACWHFRGLELVKQILRDLFIDYVVGMSAYVDKSKVLACKTWMGDVYVYVCM